MQLYASHYIVPHRSSVDPYKFIALILSCLSAQYKTAHFSSVYNRYFVYLLSTDRLQNQVCRHVIMIMIFHGDTFASSMISDRFDL